MNKDRLEKWHQEQLAEERDRMERRRHSDFYHRHFEGYSEYYEVDPSNGKSRIKRVYTGAYYSRDMSRKQRLFLKLVLTFVWLATAAVFIFCASRPYSANRMRYIVFAQVGSIVGLAWAAIGLVNCWTVPVKMVVGEWRSSSEKLRYGSICAAVFFALSAIMTTLDFFVGGGGEKTHFICAAGFLLCGVLMMLEYRIEANTRYITEQSTECVPKEAARIR